MLTLLLIAILIALIAGQFFTVAILYDLRENQNRGDAAILEYLRSLFGGPFDGEAAQLMASIKEFHKAVREGRIASLRCDDWYPRKEDFARWEAADMARSYADL